MKDFHTLLAAMLVLLPHLPANADLLQATDPTFGPNSLTIDTSTGLAWLDMKPSLGLSYDQALADTLPGGTFTGYRLATVQEVLGLFHSAGIPGPGAYPLSTPGVSTLFSLLGTTQTINGQPGLIAISGTASRPAGPPDQYLYYMPDIYAFGDNGVPAYRVSVGDALNETLASPEISSWLVKEVPEPSSAPFCALALAGLMCVRFLSLVGPLRSLRALP